VEYCKTTVLENRELGPGHGLMKLGVPQPLPDIKAGQFLSLRCDPADRHSLLRPFSILEHNAFNGSLSIYYKALGRLSEFMFSLAPGTELDCLYPLGTGFPWQEDLRRVALVGGGVGLAPLLYMSRQLEPYSANIHVAAFFGGASAADLVPELLAEYDLQLELATIDGSTGFNGTVVDLFARSTEYFDVIYTCGPNAMMAALQKRLPHGTQAYASLEEYMACSVGACYGCTTTIRTDGEERNLRVCREGPVFDLRSVVFGG
jgi:dihydroorotate dehydrogenase electron transfer subunit